MDKWNAKEGDCETDFIKYTNESKSKFKRYLSGELTDLLGGKTIENVFQSEYGLTCIKFKDGSTISLLSADDDIELNYMEKP